MKNKNGLFVSLEGIDGAGKTTQINRLRSYLTEKKYKFEILREPGGTKLSEKIREILLSNDTGDISSTSELLLYAASRAELVQKKIKPLLDDDYIVIADRFIDSTTAYQGYGRDIDLKYIEIINNFVCDFGRLVPKITFFIDITPQIALDRITNRDEELNRMEKVDFEFSKKVYNGYKQIEKTEPRFIGIDGTLSESEIFEQIVKELEARIVL